MFEKFKQRSNQQEWMDETDVPKGLLVKNLDELHVLNRYGGGYSNSLKGLKKLLANGKKSFHFVDLGCGSGDLLLYLARWSRKKGFKATFTGVDKSADAINYLQKKRKLFPEINGISADYADYMKSAAYVDIVHCGLFCHHLKDAAIVDLLNDIRQNASTGFIINDLIRSPQAYYSTLLFTSIAKATPLAKHDGPVSVLRGFKRKELERFMQYAGITSYSIDKVFAFRYLVTGITKSVN